MLEKRVSDPRSFAISFSSDGPRTKATTHIGSSSDASKLLLLLLSCPERKAGSSSPAARRGQGRLHRWGRGRERCERKEEERESAESSSRTKKKSGRAEFSLFVFASTQLKFRVANSDPFPPIGTRPRYKERNNNDINFKG